MPRRTAEDTHALSRIPLALALYGAWTAATYLLEGRLQTLLRPDAVAARLTYAVVANLLIGVCGAVYVARRFARRSLAPERLGFRTVRHAAVAIPIGLGLGLLLYGMTGAPSGQPMVVLNGFAQVLPVSVAEVLVCWAVVGGAFEAIVRRRSAVLRLSVALVASSALFGLYHFAHSPPFNTLQMVLFLAVVGLATGIFFLASRDVYGTIAFHNFLAAAGVLQAMGERALEAFARPQPHLLGMAVLAVGLLVLLHALGVRPLHSQGGDA